ncbi:interferon-induced very large GTPase 1 [Mus musculus]|uniref:interferon-induced very large GTPase 1 n=1 Tax=Mus musculus TaxID=10090 RepID=UPI00006059CE|nr:interferon-induced very large GTPase 1 [Mus musculus]
MATPKWITDEPQLRGRRRHDLEEMLTEVGLSVDYWLPKLQEDLGITSGQALQYLEKTDLQKLKSHIQHTWEKKALEKLMDLSHTNSVAELQETPGKMIKNRQRQAGQALQALRALQSEGKNREEEAVSRKEAELRQAMEIPEECWPMPEVPLKDIIEIMERHLSYMEQTLTHSKKLSDGDLVRWASGGLALQGIFKTNHPRSLIQKREELLSVPKQFSLVRPERGTKIKTKEFSSFQEQAMFTQTIERMGFSSTSLVKGEGWGISLEAGMGQKKEKASEDIHQSHSEQTYFCLTKFSYIPLATCHFHFNNLQLSKAALQELKSIEELLEQTTHPDGLPLLRHRAKNFFHRFGSHANQGPLHLGGIYCWKAISEGFKSEHLVDVKQQTEESLNVYIRSSYSGFGVKVGASVNIENSHSKGASYLITRQKFQTKVQLSVAQIGGPAEADGIAQWTAGLAAHNQTWSVIDRELQLVPIWDIILSSHRTDFKNALEVANCLKQNYTALTRPAAQIQEGEEFQTAREEAQFFLEDMKCWGFSDPEEQLMEIINFMQTLSQKEKSYDIWINTCLTDWDLQNFLINIVNFCKNSPTYKTQFIKSQLCSLLEPHVYKVTNFPQAHSIIQWINQSESEEELVKITSFSEFIKTLKKTHKYMMEVNFKNEPPETVEEAQRTATYEVTTALTSFLKYLRETRQPDMQLLLLSIAASAGYQLVNSIFQHLLGCGELNFLLDQMQSNQHKYQELKNICNYRAQAFLVLTALRITVKITDISTEEKGHRLTLIKQHMATLLTEEVAHVLTKHGEHHDWERLENDLRLLIEGNYKATTHSLQMDEVKKQLQRLCHEKKQTYKQQTNENSTKELIENGPFLDLLQSLGLDNYYPKRMHRHDFHLIYKTSVYNSQPRSEKELPFYFLQKLLMLDYGLRHLALNDDESIKKQISIGSSNHENEDFDPYEDVIKHNDSPGYPSGTESWPQIHPMDIQMAIFHCADDLTRQYILSKLSICQYALPLVVPNPNTSQVEFCLWSLRQIRKSWQDASKSPQDKSYSHRNQQMCRVSTPIVSFIRVGNGLSASKSQIMNSLLSNRKHDVFFHRHCRGSNKHCVLMQGVVEICWFYPAGQGEDMFDNCLMFTNLHGDAKEHTQQLSFLQHVSSIIVVLMSASDNNKENQKLVRHLCQSSTPLICLIDDKEKAIANTSGKRMRIGIKNRNEAELTEELTNAIKHFLVFSNTVLSLEDCSQTARELGFIIDEDQRDCKEAKEKAQTIMALLEEYKLSQTKENLLPLQGQLWHLWCKKDKEFYHLREKGNQSIEQHKSEIETEKRIIRRQQLEKAFPLNDLMRSVLELLQDYSETHKKLYFLQWLTLFFDNLTIEHLEKLHKKQRSLWLIVQTEKQKAQKSNSLTLWHKQIEAISTEIQDYTLGIEHLLREVGQIYEALEETSSSRDSLFLCLPQIAADLMIAGVPIELMDGDASYVPLRWVAAIFDKITEKVGDKRLFVLSVLGLQSSGKSTLLNTLFGLQFTVSAARCTKGAYMQFLKVEETCTEELGFDYVLVVDTEGLWAPEHNNKSQKRDNELATFVIGLGNLTLINIFGENSSEIQDILQISVQAFLRMKQVKISPSCLFVHQNVGEITAKDQTMEEGRRLEQKLDEMTALAAELEDCSNITHFSDVIKFDATSHIYYFAHLWDGNPPMAPPNPHYSYNVQELRNVILSNAQKESRGRILKISDFKFRVQDLWKALVNENFIFSFRNTQEVIAMSKLETMYSQWIWELRSHVLDLDNQLNIQIQNGKILTLTSNLLEDPLSKKYETIKEQFDKYFEKDPDSEILFQWKTNFEHKLQILKDTLISDTRRKCNEHISLKKSQEILDNRKSQYENQLLERSRKLAFNLKGKELSDEELHEKFSQLWTSWIYNVSSNVPHVTEPNIDLDSENILLEYFKKDKNIVERLKIKSREKFEILYDKHIQMKKRYHLHRKSSETCHVESIKKTTNNIWLKFSETLKNIWKQKRDYSHNYFHEILKIIENELKSEPCEGDYTFTRDYIIDLSLYLFQRASKDFKKMHEAFKTANDPVNYLERKKDHFFISFKISCQGATAITSFVDFLWRKLTPAISATIWKIIAQKLAGDMRATCPKFNRNRANLEKHTFGSITEQNKPDVFGELIDSLYTLCLRYHIKSYCSEKGNEKIKTFLNLSLGDIKNTILSAIHNSTKVAKAKGSTASGWLDLFCDHLGSNLIFPRRDLVSIEHQELIDTEFLKEAMSKALDPAMRKVEEDCSSKHIDEIVPDIEKILCDHRCGC